MTIPNTARTGLTSGFPGNISHDGPTRAQSHVLDSTSATNNVFGRAFTLKDASKETVQAGDSGAFAGIMINPKAYAIDTSAAGNGSVAEFLTMGEVYVDLTAGEKWDGSAPAAVVPAVGGKVYFMADGKITAAADSGDKASPTTTYTQIVGAVIARHTPSTATPQLAVISLTGPQAA